MTIFPSPLYAPAMKCRRLGFIVPLALALLVAPLVAEAQQVRKVPRVGYLGNVSSTPPDEAFHAGLRELGWVEGRNMVVERRYAEDRYERLPGLAAELVQLHVEVIVAGAGPAGLKAAREATRTIPIVMITSSVDPVRDGLIVSFARPGGNVTGLVSAPPGLDGKRGDRLLCER